MAKPLAGIRVIELANFIAGPLAGTLLADMGADVVKIEPPQGDMGRATPPIRNGESVSFVALNRNKRSLVLDLKRPRGDRGPAQARRASPTCSWRPTGPGALDKLGLGAEHGQSRATRSIIYTSVSGFGQTGPDRRRAGVNLIIEAFSGALSVTGEPGKMPMRPGVQTADVFGALFATYATLAGLVGAARNGEGRIADVSLVEASIAAAAWEAAEYLETGKVPQPMGNRHRLNAPYQLFETSDGRYIAIGTPNDTLFGRLMQVLGLDAASERPALCRPMPAARPTRTRCFRWSSPRCGSATRDELEAGAVEAGVPCARVNNFKEVFERPADRRARRHAGASSIRGSAPCGSRAIPVLLDHDGPAIDRHSPDAGRAFGGGADGAWLFAGGDPELSRRRDAAGGATSNPSVMPGLTRASIRRTMCSADALPGQARQ